MQKCVNCRHFFSYLWTSRAFSDRGKITPDNRTLFRTILIQRVQATVCIHVDAKIQWKLTFVNTTLSIRATFCLYLDFVKKFRILTPGLPFTHICRWRRLCQTALSSAVGARKMRTRLRGRLCGLQPPLFTISPWPFSALPFGFTETCNRNSVGRFRTVKHASAMLDNRRGSSVTKSTRSRETRANTRRSVNSSAQDGCRRVRPSTLARAPPKSLKLKFDFKIHKYYIWKSVIDKNYSRVKPSELFIENFLTRL